MDRRTNFYKDFGFLEIKKANMISVGFQIILSKDYFSTIPSAKTIILFPITSTTPPLV